MRRPPHLKRLGALLEASPTRLCDLPRNQAASERSGGSPGQASGPAERPGTAGRRGRCPAPRAAPAGGRGGPGGRRAAPAEAARAQGALPGRRDMLFHATPQDPKMASRPQQSPQDPRDLTQPPGASLVTQRQSLNSLDAAASASPRLLTPWLPPRRGSGSGERRGPAAGARSSCRLARR